MFILSEILKQKWEHNDFAQDPLTVPDDPDNPPRLIRRNFAETDALNKVPSDNFKYSYQTFVSYCPKWIQIPMNPKVRNWSYINDEISNMDLKDHFPRYLKELEIALSEGHDRIFIGPRNLAMYCAEYIRFGEHCHYYAYVWGVWSMWFNWRHPSFWWIYVPMSFTALCNAYAYTRLWMRDRLSRYELYDAEMYDVEVGTEFMIKWKDCPTNYWVLRRISRVNYLFTLLRNQTMAIMSCFATAWRLGDMEAWYLGPLYRRIAMDDPINTCDYFLPSFLDLENKFAEDLPIDIPIWRLARRIGTTADGWFILGILGLYLAEGIHSYYVKHKAKKKSGCKYPQGTGSKRENWDFLEETETDSTAEDCKMKILDDRYIQEYLFEKYVSGFRSESSIEEIESGSSIEEIESEGATPEIGSEGQDPIPEIRSDISLPEIRSEGSIPELNPGYAGLIPEIRFENPIPILISESNSPPEMQNMFPLFPWTDPTGIETTENSDSLLAIDTSDPTLEDETDLYRKGRALSRVLSSGNTTGTGSDEIIGIPSLTGSEIPGQYVVPITWVGSSGFSSGSGSEKKVDSITTVSSSDSDKNQSSGAATLAPASQEDSDQIRKASEGFRWIVKEFVKTTSGLIFGKDSIEGEEVERKSEEIPNGQHASRDSGSENPEAEQEPGPSRRVQISGEELGQDNNTDIKNSENQSSSNGKKD